MPQRRDRREDQPLAEAAPGRAGKRRGPRAPLRRARASPISAGSTPAEIVVAEWVRMKCLFGCREYGQNAACPPNTPPVDDCARFFREYKRAAVFHFAKTVDRPEDRHAWSRKLNLELLKLEQEVFKAGYVKAFLLFFDSCGICLDCAEEPDGLQGAQAGPADARRPGRGRLQPRSGRSATPSRSCPSTTRR